MTLDKVPIGSPARIVGFGSLSEAQRLRLSALGIREDIRITKILRTPLRDPIECLVGPQLLTLEAWLLPHIRVEPEGEPR